MQIRILVIIGCVIEKLLILCNRARSSYKSSIVDNLGGVIGAGVSLAHARNIHLGKRSFVNGGYLIASPEAHIKIGDDCLISYEVHLRTDMHNFRFSSMKIIDQGWHERDIVLGDDVWVGFGAQIMAGVTIGEGAVVAAGAVVTRDIAPYTIVAGVPARIIGTRHD